MARRTVLVDGHDLVIADDDAIAGDLQAWAVLRARVVDEMTGEPPRVPVRLVSPLPKALARVADGGLCGLVARPRDVAGALQTPGAMVARLEGPGYLPRDLTPDIDAARRQLAQLAAQGATALDVLPQDPIPPVPGQRLQFRQGRGVLTARPTAPQADEFTLVADSAPANAGDVPLRDGLAVARAIGTPVAGVPIALGDQPLHRARALRLRSRLRRVAAGPQPTLVPAPGASIGIVGYWPTYPSTTQSPHASVDFCAVDPPLAQRQPTGAAVAGCTLALAAPRTLRAHAAPGSRSVWVHPHAGLNAAGGDRLLLGDPSLPGHEVVVTDTIDAPLDPQLPARIRLRAPTATLQRDGSEVRLVTVQNPVPAGQVVREALPGDAVLFASQLGALASAGWLVVAAGTPQEAIHRFVQLPQATSTGNPPPNDFSFAHPPAIDADGWFEWPALARVAQLALVAVQGMQRLPEFNFALDYGGDNPLSLILP